MRFSSLVFVPFSSAFLTGAFASNATFLIQDQEAEVSALTRHYFPAVWNFELEDDFAETPEVMAQIEEAFILAANEVHDSADIKFFSVFTKGVMHEHFNKDGDSMMLGEVDEEEEASEDEVEVEDETNLARRLRWRSNFHIRPKNSRNSPLWRPNYRVVLSVACNLCGRHPDDDDAAIMMARPLELRNRFYELEHGRNIMLAWQKRFCRKLHNIKTLHKPSRCFIFLDLDHEDPAEDPQVAMLTHN